LLLKLGPSTEAGSIAPNLHVNSAARSESEAGYLKGIEVYDGVRCNRDSGSVHISHPHQQRQNRDRQHSDRCPSVNETEKSQPELLPSQFEYIVSAKIATKIRRKSFTPHSSILVSAA